MPPNPAWFGDFQNARTGAVMRRNLQTGEPELVPRQPGEARLQSGPSADLYSPNTAAGIREAGDRGWSVRTTPPSQRTFGTAGTGARQQIPAATLRLKNGQPVTEEMLKNAGFRAAMQGNKVIGTHPVSSIGRGLTESGNTFTTDPSRAYGVRSLVPNLMKQMDAPSQAFFRALGY